MSMVSTSAVRPENLARMTARSVVLSVLLGAHPACATAGELVRLTADFGIKETALRVALTRMVAGGDLIRSDGGYQLSDRLVDRQRRQDDAVWPQVHTWRGGWIMVVITNVGADARARSVLRATLQRSRFAELREGVWMRPENIEVTFDPGTLSRVRVLTARDGQPEHLAAQLWDLPGWMRAGQELIDAMDTAGDIPERFVVAAAIVRHLLTDPMLPDKLLPADWPGTRLRGAYTEFANELGRRLDD